MSTLERALTIAVMAAAVAAAGLSGLRWLRVAQREHYQAGSTLRFARRWWLRSPNIGPAIVVLIVSAGSPWQPWLALPLLVAVGGGPVGLGLHGRTSKLAWTRRLKVLAATAGSIDILVVGLSAAAGLKPAALTAAAAAAATPAVMDLALLITSPFERRAADRHVRKARDRLAMLGPKVVAVTGSFGKTTTKGYIAHLLAGNLVVVPSPASFNNRAGLARAINERLGPGTEVFIAEMGTYGLGEIAEMCSWVRPDVAVITAIGPVHLERMGDEARIAQAKSEILEPAGAVVLNVDHPLLAALADRAELGGKKVWRCSQRDLSADVVVTPDEQGDQVLVIAETPIATLRAGSASPSGAALSASPTNVACAVAVALQMGISVREITERVETLPVAPNRRAVGSTLNGATVIDDTYNANPAGVSAALDLAVRLSKPDHRLVVVTPGMVELGPAQGAENRRFGRSASEVATEIVIVGKTNRASLQTGAGQPGGRAKVILVADREAAAGWVGSNLGPGDVVLYANDLPDHFP
jgi:UDP-N-acetylmuramoyl-tripeptide--D-alanyl-D-alanine ligase